MTSRSSDKAPSKGVAQRASDFVRAAGITSALVAGLDQLVDGIVLVEGPLPSQEPRVLYVNEAFARAVGRAESELLGTTLDTLFPEIAQVGALSAALHRGKSLRRGPHLTGKDGAERFYDFSLQPVCDLEDEIVHWFGVLRDCTADRQRQQALIDREKLVAAELLAAGMVHEINNPLASLSTNLEWLAAVVPSVVLPANSAHTPRPNAIGPISAALVDALAGAERIEATIRYLSMLSGLQDAHRELLDISLVLESALSELEGVIGSDISIIRNYTHAPPVLASEQRLKQVFVNLLTNAVQAIEVSSSPRAIKLSTLHLNRVRVEIEDSGGGVPEEVRARLFTPFVTTKSLGIGKGLSLYLCKVIIESAGGEVGFRSTSGKGSTFWVELPPATPSYLPPAV